MITFNIEYKKRIKNKYEEIKFVDIPSTIECMLMSHKDGFIHTITKKNHIRRFLIMLQLYLLHVARQKVENDENKFKYQQKFLIKEIQIYLNKLQKKSFAAKCSVKWM